MTMLGRLILATLVSVAWLEDKVTLIAFHTESVTTLQGGFEREIGSETNRQACLHVD